MMLPPWSRYLSLPGVTEHTSWGDVSERALRSQIAVTCPAADQRWALVGADSQLIGTVGLNGIDLSHGRGELAYDLDPRWQGQGLATHAARGARLGHMPCALVRIQARAWTAMPARSPCWNASACSARPAARLPAGSGTAPRLLDVRPRRRLASPC
jgi:hypothetical protein